MEGWLLVVSDFGQMLLYLIGAVFVAALYVAVRQTVRYIFTENKSLQQLETNLLYLTYDAANPNYTQLTEALTNKCAQDSAAWQRVKNMYYLAAQNQPLQLSQLQQTDNLQEQATVSSLLMRYAPYAMLGFGLLGWLYGLVRLVVILWQTLQQTNATSVMQWLQMGNSAAAIGAFAEGLVVVFWAFLATVLFLLLSLPYRLVKQQFTGTLEQLSATRLLPLFSPPAPIEQINNLAQTTLQHTHEVSAAVEVLTAGTAKIGVSFDQLNRLTANLQATADAFITAQDAFAAIITHLEQTANTTPATTPAALPDTYKLVEALNLHNATIAQLTDRLYKNEFDFTDWLKEIIALTQKQHQEFKDELKSMIEMARSNLSNTNSASNRFDISAKKFKENLDALDLLLHSFANMIQEAVQKEVLKLDELSLKLQNLHQSVLVIQTDLPTHLTRMNTTLDNTHKLANPQYLEQMAKAIAADAIQKQIGIYAQEYKRLEDQIAELEKKLTEKKQSGWSKLFTKLLQFLGAK